jgi:hypothetical protein
MRDSTDSALAYRLNASVLISPLRVSRMSKPKAARQSPTVCNRMRLRFIFRPQAGGGLEEASVLSG